MSIATRLLSTPSRRTILLQRNISGERWFSHGPRLEFNVSGTRRNIEDAFEFDEKPWDFDDITPAGHAELEQVREARQYARIAAYEMPRLARLVKPFTPPNKAQCLRFRYTTYFGEKHPSESKVVLEFSALDPILPLTDAQRDKFIKLVGSRYNPETTIIKMSCQMFEEQAQNKKHLSNLLIKLLNEARDPTDTFEDIPLDLRHYYKRKAKAKKKELKFPDEWKVPVNKRWELKFQRLGAQQTEAAIQEQL